MKQFEVTENTIMWAFRYALGRKTGAVLDVCETLKKNWSQLRPFTQDQIKMEIQVAIDQDRAGSECDIEKWKEIQNL